MSIHSFGGGRGIIANRRNDAKYVAILQAAIEVMSESGYHHAQISRIAKAAGVADGTVYLYFRNKEDILVSVLRQTIGHIVQLAEDKLCDLNTAEEKLHKLVELYFAELGSRQSLAMVTQVHLRQVDANIRREIGEIMKPFYNLLDEIVEQGIQEDKFRCTLNRRIARRMLFGTIDETVTAWVLTGGKYKLDALAGDVVDVLLNGLCIQRGLANNEGSVLA
jgi:TetR/AcrR family transcriptional regulator, fatty acid metabolism regulator protein